MRFEFATAGRIVFGAGTAAELPQIARSLGQRVLLVQGTRSAAVEEIAARLAADGCEVTPLAIEGEPSITDAAAATEAARDGRCELIVAVGGGSAIDTGKAVAALLTNGGAPLDYLEVIGKGQTLREPSAPLVAVPTTAGTGAEVTRNAVLYVPEHHVKVSLRSAYMLPAVALVDPELTYSMPPLVTASTGLDALTQLIEPLVTHLANPLTDAICREGIPRAARSLRRVFHDGSDEAAREDMALASLFGGLALANAKLGAVHGFAGPLGGMIAAPHGVICARLLPHAMEMNVHALRARQPLSPALVRYDEVARLLTGDDGAEAKDGVEWLQALCAELQVPPLADYGLREADFDAAIEKARVASSMKGNPITLTDEELRLILERERAA